MRVLSEVNVCCPFNLMLTFVNVTPCLACIDRFRSCCKRRIFVFQNGTSPHEAEAFTYTKADFQEEQWKELFRSSSRMESARE